MPEKKTAYLRVSWGFGDEELSPLPAGTELLGIVPHPRAYSGELWLLIAHPDLPDDWACPACGAPKASFMPVDEGGEAAPGDF